MAPTPPPKAPPPEDARMTRGDRDEQHLDERPGERRVFSHRDWEKANAPTDPEQRRAFREKWSASHLPNLPTVDGWHRCWVSTKHPTDTPEKRLALGYRYVPLDSIKTAGWSPDREVVKDGSTPGGEVRWREMVGMEIPMEDFLAYCREFHHDQPREMAAQIYNDLQGTAAEAAERGGRVDMSEGFKEMARYRRAPTQFEG